MQRLLQHSAQNIVSTKFTSTTWTHDVSYLYMFLAFFDFFNFVNQVVILFILNGDFYYDE